MDEEKIIVTKIDDETFRINLPKKTSPNWALINIGAYRLSVILDKSQKHVTAVQGKRDVLILWLKELGISSTALESIIKALN